MERFERYAEIERNEQRAESYLVDDAEIVLAAYGASARVARSAVNAARESGIKAGLVRPDHALALSAEALKATFGTAKAISGGRDEHGPDARRRASGRRGPRSRVVLRAHRRRHPDACGGSRAYKELNEKVGE